MSFQFHLPAGAAFRSLRVVALLALLAIAPLTRADPAPAGDELKLAIILTRHGVRAPLKSNEEMAKYAAKPWPKWDVAPAIQTPRGNQLVAMMADYYRARFMRSGLLSGDPATDAPLVYLLADNDQRTIETTRLIGKGLVPVGEPEVHFEPEGTKDPLFQPFKAHVGHADTELAASAVLGRLGGDPSSIQRAYAPIFEELKGVLWGSEPVPADAGLSGPDTVSPGKAYVAQLAGPLLIAEQCTDSFLLEYAQGMPASDVGWGKVDEKVLTDLLTLHGLFFDLGNRTFYVSQVMASNLAGHILDTLEQGATGEPVPGAIGPEGEHIVVLGGHDSNIANIGGLFGMNWWIPGTQINPMLPGGALVFELWKRAGDKDAYFVRTCYVSQDLKQLREATPLSLENPPAIAPIFIPGCSGVGPKFDAPLPAFVRQARKVIDPSFITPEP